MAVSVDTVYQRVLAILNKEQRGYVTPQEFNLFANQAQSDIFEQYFYDINQFGRMHGNDTEYSDMLNLLNEKINIFEKAGNMTYSAPNWTVPSNLYRLGTIIYNNIEVERINANEYLYINASPLTKPTDDRPIFVASSTGYKVYGGLIVRSSNSTLNGAVSSSTTINISAANPSISIGNIVTGTGISGVVTVVAISSNGTTITLSSAQSILNSTVLTFTTPAPTQLITAGVSCNYIKVPATVEWAYNTVVGRAVYNASSATNFELHASEETELVFKILQLAGLSIKELQVYQIGNQMEGQNTQQEKA